VSTKTNPWTQWRWFSSSAALRLHFRRIVGVTAVAYRDSFGAPP